jgi:type I restriction-modification system DNA methylase subunit
MMDLVQYIAQLQAHLTTGEAREHTYRPALISLFENFNDIQAANDQARTAHGATDFVYRSKSNLDIVLGYGEAKDINVSLDKTEKTEQLDRYSGYNNLLLTNGIEFRFYKNGKRYSQVEIAKLSGLRLAAIPENFQSLVDEIQSFFEQPPEVIKSGKRLSEIMGAKARRIRSNINILLKLNAEDETRAAEIAKVYQLMKNLLVHDLESDKFADMYAQTLVYGLFVARYNDETPDGFSRVEARDLIPASNPFLREFFDHIAGPRFEKGLSIIVDELCQVFSVSNVTDIIDKHLKLNDADQADVKDPIIHFYEDFLSEYNPVERKKMGAYYTPIPVVQYMVRAVDDVLKTHFNLPKGLADSSTETCDVISQGKKAKQTYHKVQILDPATGTATFLNETIKFVADKFKGQEGMWPDYARNNLIPRLHGFELMMGAYTIAHLKLGLTLKNLGVDDIGERLGVYLTNSLEEGIPHQPDLFSFGLSEAVTHESAEAAHIKSERPIMVIIGNPPYSVSTNNKTEYAQSLIVKYREGLNTRNTQPLSDDYVKFISMAETMIQRNGEGILSYISNRSFLDSMVHKTMRKSLMYTFDEIYILDLNGDSNINQADESRKKDQNVFDIKQGVCIYFMIKKTNSSKSKVFYKSIIGSRGLKFEYLNSSSFNKKDFQELQFNSDRNYFNSNDYFDSEKYDLGFSIGDMYGIHSSAIATSNDEGLVSLNRSERHGTRFAYRIFDLRYIDYDLKKVKGNRYNNLVRYLWNDTKDDIYENSILCCSKNVTTPDFSSVMIANALPERKFCDYSRGPHVFPLWLYDEQGNKTSNLNAEIVKAIKIKAPDCDEQNIFDYIYGILHWPAYRTKYKEFLKIDFPRVPYPANQAEFDKFRAVGEKLRGLHLMSDPSVNDFITTFPVAGTNEVTKLKYEDGKVYINENQYFGNVPEAAWNFYIGGYQPAQKWLKDRKDRTLNFEDIEHYQKIIKVLAETDKEMKEI